MCSLDIAWFSGCGSPLSALSTVIITIMMFDWSVSRVGRDGAALLTSMCFGVYLSGDALMHPPQEQFHALAIAISFSLTTASLSGCSAGFPKTAEMGLGRPDRSKKNLAEGLCV